MDFRFDLSGVLNQTVATSKKITAVLRNRQYLAKAPIAQLDRASDFESEGREFESLWARQRFQ